ncbi:SesA protein [Fusarium bulbicola]|nr:SesA protein [Fusarium bulbicola]
MDSIIPIINTTTSTLSLAEEAYGKMEKSNQLKISFHQAGKQLETVKYTLSMIKDFIKSGNSSGDDDAADTCIRTCCDNASFLQRAFADVASAPDHERLKQYRIYLKHQGKEYRVEVLVRAMMIDTCELAKHAGAEGTVTSELKSMRWSIKKFDEAILKQDEEDEKMRGAGGASHSGVGDLYHAKDDATQNNIKDNGTQYFGSSGGGWPQKKAPQ